MYFALSRPGLVAAVAVGCLAGRVASHADELSWTDARAQASALTSQMSPEEQNNLTVGLAGTACSGATGSVSRLEVPRFCFQDAEAGVRGADLVNAYAAGIAVAASWNPQMAQERGRWLGREFKAKGAHVLNGPVVGPLGRIATDGRVFEGFGADPYLAGKLAAASINGIQESVIACIKHFIANEQETNRAPFGNVSATSANLDDQTLHELYLWPFQDAVRGNVACVMTSYNRVNNTYASANDHTLNDILKGELAFPGFVVSDWGAQHSGVESANAGLDVAMPASASYWTDLLPGYVAAGSLTAERLADMASRLLTAWYKVIGGPEALFPDVSLVSDLTLPHPLVEARDPGSKHNRLQQAIEAHVLVKNENGALPLRQPRILSIFGVDAVAPPINNPSAPLIASKYDYGLQSVNLTIAQAAPLLAGGTIENPPETGTLGLMWNGVGSGANNLAYLSTPFSAIQNRAYEDDTFTFWDFQSTSPDVNPESDACLVFLNEAASEGLDRPGLADRTSDTLVTNVATKCRHTIVIIHNPGIRLVDRFIDHPNVTAVLFAHYPGQDAGRALTRVLYGDVSPSGRLPYTVARNETDYGHLLGPCERTSPADLNPQCTFTERTATDYRHFLAAAIPPRYPFGHGLTYTTFAYAALSTTWRAPRAAIPATPPSPAAVVPGGPASLFAVLARASFTLANTGAVPAAEVPQLYVHFPDEPNAAVHVLRGFTKVMLRPGERRNVSFDLTRRDLSRWDAGARQWRLPGGPFEVRVGRSAGEIEAVARLMY